jgi:hypothetical protein
METRRLQCDDPSYLSCQREYVKENSGCFTQDNGETIIGGKFKKKLYIMSILSLILFHQSAGEKFYVDFLFLKMTISDWNYGCGGWLLPSPLLHIENVYYLY